jgi:hypothetical protein
MIIINHHGLVRYTRKPVALFFLVISQSNEALADVKLFGLTVQRRISLLKDSFWVAVECHIHGQLL